MTMPVPDHEPPPLVKGPVGVVYPYGVWAIESKVAIFVNAGGREGKGTPPGPNAVIVTPAMAWRGRTSAATSAAAVTLSFIEEVPSPITPHYQIIYCCDFVKRVRG